MSEIYDPSECIHLIFIFSCALCSLQRNLAAIQDREICCYSISCKEKDNIGELLLMTQRVLVQEPTQYEFGSYINNATIYTIFIHVVDHLLDSLICFFHFCLFKHIMFHC